MIKTGVSKSIIESFSKDTHGLTLKYRNQVQAEIKEWIATKNKLDKRVRSQYEIISKTKDLGRTSSSGERYDISSRNLRRLYKNYADQKGKIKELQSLDKIAEHYKKGYKIIHKIREDLTGQEITYSIAFKKEGKIMEAKLTLDQILTATKISYTDVKSVNTETDLSNFLNLSIRNAQINKLVQGKLDKNMKDLDNVINQIEKPKLWDRLAELHQGQNFGYVYEVYKTLRTSYSKINNIGDKQMGLEATLYKNAKSNNIPGWQAGDVGLEQLKAVFKSSANLINVSTIEKVLTQINLALSTLTPKELEIALNNIFTVQLDHFDTKFNETVNKEAQEFIHNVIEDNK